MHRRWRTRRWRPVTTAVVLAFATLALLAASASAAPIPGATYTGTGADGASLKFTVSSDGTRVASYSILGAHGTYQGQSGDVTCGMVSNGDAGVWPGAPISGTSFAYSAGNTSFAGTFNADGSVSGTFELDIPPSGQAPDCNTGTVAWTAMTTATAHGGTQGSNGGTPSPSGGTALSAGTGRTSTFVRKRVASRLTFSQLSRRRLGGRVRSANSACLSRRIVYLWRGHRRIAVAHSTIRGRYSFRLVPAMRGWRVRVTTAARSTRLVSCAAAARSFRIAG